MFRLLIVDDEPDIADSLYMLFTTTDRLELDVYRAYSGEEALDWLNRTKIDIVLTDIRMPEMNGLQLLEAIRASWPQCRVIFLTGYNEFDYVYAAIKYSGVSYLLKTESHEAIINEVAKMAADIEKSLRIDDLLLKVRQQMTLTIPQMQREYLINLLEAGEKEIKSRFQQFKDLNIGLDAERPVLLLMGHLEEISKDISYMERSEILRSIREISENYFSPVVRNLSIEYERFSLVWIIQPKEFAEVDKDDQKELFWKHIALFVRDTLETIQSVSFQSLNAKISFVVDNKPVEWEAISEEFDSLKQLLYYRIGSGFDMQLIEIGLHDEIESDGLIPGFDIKQIRLLLRKIHEIENYLESGQKKESEELLIEVTCFLKEIKSKNYNPAIEIYYSISLMFLSYINRWNLTEKIAFRIGLNKLTRADEHATWKDAVDYFFQLLNIIFEIRQHEEEGRALVVINNIQKYVNEHMNEDLSLVRLGELFHFNPSYLSRLFKEVTGTNLSGYISDVRLEKAKELLRENKYRVHEIASRLGYISAPYFTRIFKKAVNMSPQEYRSIL